MRDPRERRRDMLGAIPAIEGHLQSTKDLLARLEQKGQ